jgi:carboxymethylenebutenolidase
MSNVLPAGSHTSAPTGAAQAVVLVLHEAFGVTPHIQYMCDVFAKEGFLAIAPALFAAAGGPTVLPQDGFGLHKGRELITALPISQVIAELTAIAAPYQAQGLPVLVVGYCWGGSLAYRAAAEIPGLTASVGYYGGFIAQWANEMPPQCPFQGHIALNDAYLPVAETLAALEKRGCPAFGYAADHGFNRHDGKTFAPAAAALAQQRTLAFFHENLAKTKS